MKREKLPFVRLFRILCFSSEVFMSFHLKHRVYIFALNVIKFIDTLNRKDWSVQVIAKQLLRSGTSIGANIIEAHGSSTKKDFINFFHHALKSANETKFWLALLQNTKKSNYKSTSILLKETVEIAKIIGASIATMKGKRKTIAKQFNY